jgi:CAI-1 autoinducer synthase
MKTESTLRPNQKFSPAKDPEFVNRRVRQYYVERVMNTWKGGHILRGKKPGPNDIHLMSNDYLALARHPDILLAQSESLLAEGNGMLMSAVFLSDQGCPQHRFEQRLAHFMGAERGILCQSGWCANVGLIQSIADEQTPVYIDMFAHMSLWEGARSAGATAVTFHHNDPVHLEKQVLKHGPGIIAVDSIYSTSGEICPLGKLVEVGNRHGCALVVDESHSLGTHGIHGEGLVASLGLSSQVHFITASLAKAFAGRAGFITCRSSFYDYFMCESRPFIFSSALLPHEIAALDMTLSIIQRDDWRREAVHSNANYLRDGLDELGYNVQNGKSQIIALEAGTEQQTMILRDALEARGIFGAVFFAPATPKNRSLMRFSVHSKLTRPELDRILQACADIRDEVGMANWASTRRKRHAEPVAPAGMENRELHPAQA